MPHSRHSFPPVAAIPVEYGSCHPIPHHLVGRGYDVVDFGDANNDLVPPGKGPIKTMAYGVVFTPKIGSFASKFKALWAV